jgi:hypothetical protein
MKKLIIVPTLILLVPGAVACGTTAASSGIRVATNDGPTGAAIAHLTAIPPKGRASAGGIDVNSAGIPFVSRTIRRSTGNVGRVLKVLPNRKVVPFGPPIRLGHFGALTGLVVAPHDHVYVATSSYGPRRNTIYRITSARLHPVARTAGSRTGYSAPNGLAFHNGRLYVTDPFAGAVWRFRPSRQIQGLTRPWLQTRSLTARTPGGWGVYGIAFRRNTLWLTNSDRGLLLRVVDGTPCVVLRSQRLDGADGLTFDKHGQIRVAVAGPLQTGDTGSPARQALLTADTAGRVLAWATDKDWMDGPVAVALGRGQTSGRLLVLNDGRYDGHASVVSLPIR